MLNPSSLKTSTTIENSKYLDTENRVIRPPTPDIFKPVDFDDKFVKTTGFEFGSTSFEGERLRCAQEIERQSNADFARRFAMQQQERPVQPSRETATVPPINALNGKRRVAHRPKELILGGRPAVRVKTQAEKITGIKKSKGTSKSSCTRVTLLRRIVKRMKLEGGPSRNS